MTGAPTPGENRCTAQVHPSNPRYPDRCLRAALIGTTVCLVHGGRLPNVRRKSENTVQAAKDLIYEEAHRTILAIIRMRDDRKAPANARLDAAKHLSKLAGLLPSQKYEVDHQSGLDPELMNMISDAKVRASKAEALEDGHIVEAEVVTDYSDMDPNGEDTKPEDVKDAYGLDGPSELDAEDDDPNNVVAVVFSGAGTGSLI